MRKWLGIFVSIVFGITLALIVADVGIRIANHWFPYFYCYSPHRGWGLEPGATGYYDREGESYVRINRDGFRGPNFTTQKPPDTIRIAVLGDSYVEAIQVAEDKTFVDVIQRKLKDCPLLKGKHIQVMNFGVDGYGTAQELITLKRKVWAYHPDIVVLAIFLGNDIRNNSVVLEGDQCRPFYGYVNNKLVLTGPFIQSKPFRLWCMARFEYRDVQLLALVENAWDILTSRRGVPTPQHPVERAINYNIYKPPTDKAWRNAWHVTFGLITAIRDNVVAHHAMFLAVTEDTGIQVWPNPAVREAFMRKLGVKNLYYPDEQIAALGKREGFAVLTLAPFLAQYAEQHNVYLHGFNNTPMGFGHWNATGHAIAGKLIAKKLCEMITAGQCETCAVAQPAAATKSKVGENAGEAAQPTTAVSH